MKCAVFEPEQIGLQGLNTVGFSRNAFVVTTCTNVLKSPEKFPALNCAGKIIESAGLCLPSLLRREKMPGYANEQSDPALCLFDIFSVDLILHYLLFLTHQ
jgi:hypothetical protein